MTPEQKRKYLHLAQASQLKDFKDRFLYRVLEILPGFLAWLTLLAVVLLSWLRPVWVAVFIIIFDLYWLLKTIYLSFHLRAAYHQMKKHLQIDWLRKLNQLPLEKNWTQIYHLVILPMYQESFKVVSASLRAIEQSFYPLEKLIVVLAVEERAGSSAQQTAEAIKKRFGQAFGRLLITRHPANLPGEIPGKGANATWAAQEALKKAIVPLGLADEQVVVSCFDIDTQVAPHYFACLTYHYLTAKKPERASYQPIPIYNNNIWFAPAISRVVATSGTFWQMMQQQRPERLSTFSSQSISLKALKEVGFWQTNIVSEDSRIFWQCFLFYQGDYRTIPLYYPVSMDANLAPTFFRTAINVYRQQRRWGWGVENIPYLFFAFFKDGWFRGAIPLRKKLHWTWIQLEGFWSWSTNAILIFMLGWLPLFLGGQEFNVTLLSYNLPRVTRTIMTIAMVGLVGSAIYSTLLLPKRPPQCPRWRYLIMVVQWLLLPITIFVFGALPGLEAQTRLMLGKYMGFWVTEKYRPVPSSQSRKQKAL